MVVTVGGGTGTVTIAVVAAAAVAPAAVAAAAAAAEGILEPAFSRGLSAATPSSRERVDALTLSLPLVPGAEELGSSGGLSMGFPHIELEAIP